jgi:hypothetical protein
MTVRPSKWLLITLSFCIARLAAAELIESRKIWDAASHNAFTDLARFHEKWWCVFREGKTHISPDGKVRILRSQDAAHWESAALIGPPDGDLRDPKLSITPRNRLMIVAAIAYPKGANVRHQSVAYFSDNGTAWEGPVKVGDPNVWLWRVTWHKDKAYGVGYDTSGEKLVRLYQSKDGREFEPVVSTLFNEEQPNETSLVFLPDDTALCFLRRDGPKGTGLLGSAKPPYTDWAWKDSGVKIGGPHMIRLPDGRLIAGVRLYDGGARTAIMSLDSKTGKLTELVKLPSGGDTSYPGLVWHDGLLWISYYSSHEGKTSIYLAKARF